MSLDPVRKHPRMHQAEDKHQELIETPYGKGLVIRTRRNGTHEKGFCIREIELLDWGKPGLSDSRAPRRPNMLYSPTEFQSVKPEAGSDVITIYGRGKVMETRESDGNIVVVVRISSWRLAGRSTVTCYLAPGEVRVVRPHKIYEMSIHEKVEHAQYLKEKASNKFVAKAYEEALQLYAEAVDAVRYIQHKKDSTNALRADLLVVMITCCNNAATCCLQLKFFDRAQKFGKNALVLLEALYEKKGNSRIHDLLNRDGIGDSQLFGTWKVKSYLVIARGLAEKHETDEAIVHLKKALKVIDRYKSEGDCMFKQLEGQEKETRKLLLACKERQKAVRRKEKQRAQAMFAKSKQKAPPEKRSTDTTATTNNASPRAAPLSQRVVAYVAPSTKPGMAKKKTPSSIRPSEDRSQKYLPPKKRVSFADGSVPGSIDDDTEPSFLEEHKEALLIIGGVATGAALVHLLFRRKR